MTALVITMIVALGLLALWLVRAAASELVDERANRRPPLPGRGK